MTHKRGAFLYNSNREFCFDKNLENATVVSLLDFENIPEQARRYITIKRQMFTTEL